MIKKIICFTYKNIFSHRNISVFNSLKKREVFDKKANSEYQIDKLSNVLEVTFTNIPYYKDLRFNVKDFSYADFKKLPILTKEIIRTQTDRLVNPNYGKMDQVYKNTSGGSTGEPVTFFRTKEQSLYGNANYLLGSVVQSGKKIQDPICGRSY